MSQPELFKISLTQEKYQNSRFSNVQIETEAQRLEDIMVNETLYREPKLTKQDLEIRMGLNSADISRIINEGFKKNFFDFVNSYRITEFIKLVESEKFQNYTLLAIAKEAGFNSKTTFNAAFKKQTGKTPKSYLDLKVHELSFQN